MWRGPTGSRFHDLPRRQEVINRLWVPRPAGVDFQRFDHDAAVDRDVRAGKREAEFIVACHRWTFCQVDFIGDVRWDVHAGITSVCGDVDVGFPALNNDLYWYRSAVDIQTEFLLLVQVIESKRSRPCSGCPSRPFAILKRRTDLSGSPREMRIDRQD